MAKFQPGRSGNPAGKKPGTRHKATRAALLLMEGDLENITRALIEKARGGDLLACRLVLDKLLPNARERHLEVKMPEVNGANLPAVLAAVLKSVANGELTPGEGSTITAMLETYRKSIELEAIEKRLRALEGKK